SRRRHTRFSRDWSSDVCSSDLLTLEVGSVSFDVMHIIPRETAEAVVSALAGGVSGAAEAAAAGEAALAAASAGRTVPRVAGGKEIGRASCRGSESVAMAGAPRT